MYEVFCAECKKVMRLRKMGNAELATATGYKTSTIDGFFSNLQSRGRSAKVAKAISNALGVDLA